MPQNIGSNFNPFLPLTFSRAADGSILTANGLNKAKRWDGLSTGVENAGVPRAAAFSLATSGAGSSTSGKYYAGVRFLDDEGYPGDLSTLVSLTVTTNRNFAYTSIPVSTDPRVTKKQLFRSTAGQGETLYLDSNMSSNSVTSWASTFSDTQLQAREALPILNPDGTPNARRFGVPPNHKTVVIAHQDRSFWGVDAVYDEGHVQLTSGSVTCTGIGTSFTAQMENRKLYVRGHDRTYTCSAVSPTAQTITLHTAFEAATDPFALYAVKPQPDQRRLFYYSEAGLHEAVPGTNAIYLQEDGSESDEETAMMSMGAFVFIFTERHVYRWTFQGDPAVSGAIYLTANRGCLNARTWVRVEDYAFVMDRGGIYLFNGGATDPVSLPIQDYFRSKIVWDNAKWFHAAAYPEEETIKFFICLDGSKHPKHSLCYNYRRGMWWEETYPWEVGSSDSVPIASRIRLLVGAEHERVMLASESSQDGPTSDITVRSSVSTATAGSVTLATTSISSDLVGAEIAIVDGPGAGQYRRILSASSTTGECQINTPWMVRPTAKSTYHVAGPRWEYRTGQFRFAESHQELGRHANVLYEPTEDAGGIDLRTYRNRSQTPDAIAGDVNEQDGVVAVRGEDRAKINTKLDRTTNQESNGYAIWRFDSVNAGKGPRDHFIQFELSGVGSQIIFGIDLMGVR